MKRKNVQKGASVAARAERSHAPYQKAAGDVAGPLERPDRNRDMVRSLRRWGGFIDAGLGDGVQLIAVDEDDLPMCYPDLVPDENGLVGVGGRLSPELVLEMVTRGVFPWTGEHPIPWFSPDPRLILIPNDFKVSRSFAKVLRKGDFEVRFDTAFRRVMARCADVARPDQDGTWITDNMHEVFGQLHDLGVGHSVEVWRNKELVGGLYGLSLGSAFFGESMFHSARDMSKVALHALCERLVDWGFDFIDCQQETSHLASLGAIAVPRLHYLKRLERALQKPTRIGTWTLEDAPTQLL